MVEMHKADESGDRAVCGVALLGANWTTAWRHTTCRPLYPMGMGWRGGGRIDWRRQGVKAKWGGGCIRRPLPLPGNPPPIPFVGTIVYAARAAGFRSSENFL